MAKKTEQIVFRVTKTMYQQLQDNADVRGMTVSDYLRCIVKPSMYRHGASLGSRAMGNNH